MNRTVATAGIAAALILGEVAIVSHPDMRKALTRAMTTTSTQMLDLARTRQWVTMAVVGREYQQSHPRISSGFEHCWITLYTSWAEIMLDHHDASLAALIAYQRGCTDRIPGPSDDQLAQSIRRVLNGEATTVMY